MATGDVEAMVTDSVGRDAPARMLRLKQVLERTGLGKTTIYELQKSARLLGYFAPHSREASSGIDPLADQAGKTSATPASVLLPTAEIPMSRLESGRPARVARLCLRPSRFARFYAAWL